MLWAKLADESIKRYATLERESGINFYDEVGYLLLTADVDTPTSYGAQVVAAAHQLGLTRQDPALDNASAGPAESTLNKRTYAVLAEEAMKARFPLLSVFPGAVGVYQQYVDHPDRKDIRDSDLGAPFPLSSTVFPPPHIDIWLASLIRAAWWNARKN